MPRQLSLLTSPKLTIQSDAKRTEPKFWVRRFAVWSKPGVLIRDIHLRPGLNVIWSKDEDSIGHGAGKTLFCRLLRFALGEPQFAPDIQRSAILQRFPEGIVGVEVILNGQTWSITRRFARGVRYLVAQGEHLESLLTREAEDSGPKPFETAALGALLDGQIASLFPPELADRPWLAALAWATRDQECRFADPLDWRAASAGSGSPIRDRDLSKADLLQIVRALLRMVTADEIAHRQTAAEADRNLQKAREAARILDRDLARLRSRLRTALGLNATQNADGALDLAAIKISVSERILATGLSPDGHETALEAARMAHEQVRVKVEELERTEERLSARIEASAKLILSYEASLPQAKAKLRRLDEPVCPFCDVLVDKVLADGCPISHDTADLVAIRARIDDTRNLLQDENTNLEGSKSALAVTKTELSGAIQRLAAAHTALQNMNEKQRLARLAWRDASSLAQDVDRLAHLEIEFSDAHLAVSTHEQTASFAWSMVRQARKEAENTIRAFSDRFDAVVAGLLGGDARGGAYFTETGLMRLNVELGGERESAAIESLKVLAFDFSALTLSIEDKACALPFLLHDSPREADLQNNLYARIFELGRDLETQGHFQYIITTTTAPPEWAQAEPYLRLTLRGAPAFERLLGVDL